MGKHLFWSYSSPFAESFHLPPNVRPIHWFPRSRYKHRSAGVFLFLNVLFQQSAQLIWQKHCPAFALVAHLRAACMYSLYCHKLQLRHTYSSRADGLKDQRQPFLPLPFRRPDQTGILALA